MSQLQIKRAQPLARAQWDFWTHPPPERTQVNEMPMLSVSSVFQERPDDKAETSGSQGPRVWDCFNYYTIIHPWAKTHEKLSSLNRGRNFQRIVGVWAQFRWAFYSDSHKLQLRVCHLVGFVIWRFGWSSMCFQTHSGGWQNSLPSSCMAEAHGLLLVVKIEATLRSWGLSSFPAIWPFS